MKFYFEIPDEELQDMYEIDDFKHAVIQQASNELVKRIFNNLHFDTRNIAQQIIKENKEKIIAQIIVDVENKVAESIAKKKKIAEIIPKASTLATINKENETYFMELIDKAIAKRFK